MIRSVAPRLTLLLISWLVVLLKILGIRSVRRESVLVKAGCRTLKFHALWNESAFPRLFLRFQHSHRIVVPSLGERESSACVWIVACVRGIRSQRENGSSSSRGEDEKIEVTRERDSWDRCRFLVLSGPNRQHRIPLTESSPVLDAFPDHRYGKNLGPRVYFSRDFFFNPKFYPTWPLCLRRSNIDVVESLYLRYSRYEKKKIFDSFKYSILDWFDVKRIYEGSGKRR